MKKNEDTNLLVEVSKSYYLYGNTQSDVAKEFGLSRPMVSQLLSIAKQKGIVEISYKINDPRLNNDELSAKLERLFGVPRCVVVPVKKAEGVDVLKVCAERSVQLVNDAIKSKDIMGISWGRTCYEFMEAYKPYKHLFGVQTVPLIGGIDLGRSRVQMNEMVQRLAEKVHGDPWFIYAPAITESAEETELYMQSSQMKEIVARWDELNLAVTSLGRMIDFKMEQPIEVNSANTEYFLSHREIAIGDLCSLRFNIYGELLRDDYAKRLIHISMPALKKVPLVISLATGIEKIYASYAVLQAGLIHTFVCDMELAEGIISLYQTIHGE